MIHPLADVQSQEIGVHTNIWQFCVVLPNAIIGDHCNISCNVFIENEVIIGNHVTIKPGVQIWDGITIEDDVFIGPNATFTNDKWPKSRNMKFVLQQTIVKKGASVGANATILCGITIGSFALIAAGSTVTQSVPDRALMIGNPARIAGWMNEDGTKMREEDGFFLDNNGQLWKVYQNELVRT